MKDYINLLNRLGVADWFGREIRSKILLVRAILKGVALFLGVMFFVSVGDLFAVTGNWSSVVAGGNIDYTATEAVVPAKDAGGKFATVVYLENLGFDKIGGNSNAEDVAWLLSKGYRVIELDYAKNTNAVSPKINNDIIAINDAISSGAFCDFSDCSMINSYVLMEGYRIKRNVPYFVDDPFVYYYAPAVKDSLYMDIIYPANASVKVPTVLSFSYSNSYANNIHQRLFLGYTLAMFDDSFLEGAPASGMAWAIDDHPKYAPWGYDDTKSFEVNPDAAQKVKSAIRTLRVLSEELGLSNDIGIYGFSRGSDAGSMAVGDKTDETVDNAGFNIGVSDDIQAAALGSGVFDFTQIYNASGDGDANLERLCPELWGDLDKKYDLWYSMGAAYFVETEASAPTMFFFNENDADYYMDQRKHFKKKLEDLGVPTDSVLNYSSGHAVPATEESLAKLYSFFKQYLKSEEEPKTWTSVVTGDNIVYTSTEATTPAKDAGGKFATVVYLENLGFDKIGQNSNEEDVVWLLSKGYRVIELDYVNNTNAVSPAINEDIMAINDAISSGSFCGYTDCSTINSYVLMEGYRIKRNVPYFVDNPSIYYAATETTGDSLYLDIVYPANALEDIPVVLSFSYSNSYYGNIHQRLFLGYTLAMFGDSFLEGAPASGIAWAIADHPKYANWGTNATKSFEVNPDAAQKVKSAVRTLRVLGDDLGLSGKIGIYGFSRGSDAGSMAVGDKADETVDNAGFNIGVSAKVQAAALGPGVFDFTQIYNATDDGDGNLERLCPELWGPLSQNYDLWYSMGAAYFVETKASAPTIFFFNEDDADYYMDQRKHFRKKLDDLGVATDSVINYSSGHAVPTTSESLSKLYSFFNEKFAIEEDTTGINSIEDGRKSGLMPIEITPNPVSGQLNIKVTLQKPACVQFAIYDIAGALMYQTNDYFQNPGKNNKSIILNCFNLASGAYLVKVEADGMQGYTKFIKKEIN